MNYLTRAASIAAISASLLGCKKQNSDDNYIRATVIKESGSLVEGNPNDPTTQPTYVLTLQTTNPNFPSEFVVGVLEHSDRPVAALEERINVGDEIGISLRKTDINPITGHYLSSKIYSDGVGSVWSKHLNTFPKEEK